MARFQLTLFVQTIIAEMALAEETAYPSKPSDFVSVPNLDDSHVQYLGEFAVKWYNEQTKAYLEFIHVDHAEVLDHGTEHYTYILLIKVHEGCEVKVYKSEVFQDLGAPELPPLLNLRYFEIL